MVLRCGYQVGDHAPVKAAVRVRSAGQHLKARTRHHQFCNARCTEQADVPCHVAPARRNSDENDTIKIQRVHYLPEIGRERVGVVAAPRLRGQHLAAIEATIDRAPGAPPVLVSHGDLGVGKTTLLKAGIEYARQRAVRVVGGTGDEADSSLAYAGLHQLVTPVMSYLDHVEPYHREVLRRALGYADGPPPDRLAISSATLAVLVAVAEDGRLC